MTELLSWNFDEASGAVIDYSGNGRVFTPSGNTVRTSSSGGHTAKGLTQTSAESTAGPSITGLQTTSRTWMAWVKFDAAITGWVMEFYDSGQDTGRWGLLDLGGTLRFRAKNAVNSVFESSTIAHNLGVFQHIAATHDGSNLKTYVNGTLLNTTAMASAVGTADIFRVLDQTGTSVTIDDARLFDAALDQATISSLMNTPVGSSGTKTYFSNGSQASAVYEMTAGGLVQRNSIILH